MPDYRKANSGDLEFLVRIDLEVDREDGYPVDSMSEDDRIQHRAKIASYLSDVDKGAVICQEGREPIGAIIFRIRHCAEQFQHYEVFGELPRSVFPENGCFIEIFQLWVHPHCRRQGIASELKRQVEHEAIARGIHMIYTHTEESNQGTIHLNAKLGYQEIRRGVIDGIARVSLAKYLE